MLTRVFVLFGFVSIMLAPSSKASCPVADSLNKYIQVPVVHNLAKVAQVENIPNMGLHEGLYSQYAGVKLNVHYRHLNKFDKNLETIIIIPGGPGQTVESIETFVQITNEVSPFFQNYNAIAMDHRGIACSTKVTSGKLPVEAHKMRFAAADIELIRQELTPGKRIHVWGYSYGSVLAQTYTLLYPASVDLLYLGGSYRKASEFIDVRLQYKSLVATSSTGLEDYKKLTDKYPQYIDRFLDYTVGEMYWYGGRTVEVPKFLKSILKLLDMNLNFMVDNMFKAQVGGVISPLMTSVGCSEVFDYSEERGAYPMFREVYNLCKKATIKRDFFDYSNYYSNIKAKTFIWAAKFDHVTPPTPMVKMAKDIKGSILYIDQHLGHIPYAKAKCMALTMEAFFARKSDKEMLQVIKSKACTDKPKALDPRRI
jgi:pimeloyl-ACP methyl ester carboxylesterase